MNVLEEDLSDATGMCESRHCGCPMKEHEAKHLGPYLVVFICRNGCSCPDAPADHVYYCASALNRAKIAQN